MTGILVRLSLPASTPAVAASRTAPLCKASQIHETFVPQKVAPSAPESFRAWVFYTNTGGRCRLPITYIGLEALSGTNVLEASVTPTNYILGNVVLDAGRSARAQASAMRVRSFGKGCKAKAANRLFVLPLYNGWTKRSFRLAPSVLVCTGGDINIAGSDVTKVPLTPDN
jgi:hypothetical protein